MTIEMNRVIHIPGSLPESMDIVELDELLTCPPSVAVLAEDPDPHWLTDYIMRRRTEALGNDPRFRVAKDGECEDYDDAPILRPQVGRRFRADWLVDHDRINRNEQTISTLATRPDIKRDLQLSVPCYLDAAMYMVAGRPAFFRHFVRTVNGMALALANLKVFREAAMEEINAAIEHASHLEVGERLRWSLEAPSVLYALHSVPAPLRPLVTGWLAERVLHGLADIPDGRAVLHLCCGRLNGEAIVHPKTTAPMVRFLNVLGPRLDRNGITRPPVHMPIHYDSGAVRLDDRYYAPLTSLDAEWRVIAGVLNPEQPNESADSLHKVEAALGRAAYGVSTSCGWGEWRHSRALRALELLHELSKHPTHVPTR
jgi:hypothetical protein